MGQQICCEHAIGHAAQHPVEKLHGRAGLGFAEDFRHHAQPMAPAPQ